MIKARNKLKQLKHLHTTQKTFQSTMVVTTNMEEFISNIRNERMNQFWNDTKKFQKFSPTTEDDGPSTTEKQGFQIRNTVIAHVPKQYFRTDEEAIRAAISAQFKCVVKLEPNQYKFVYPQSGTKKKVNILSELVVSPMHTTWVF
mgnify:CR=1 FL=1